MKSGFKAVGFDLDGTLYPNGSFYIRLLPFLAKNLPLLLAFGKARAVIRSEQEQPGFLHGQDFYDYQAGITAKMLKKGDSAAAVKERIERLMYRGWEPHFSKVRLFRHVKEVLADFRAAGLKLALLSDFPPEAKLENMGLAGFWDCVLCSESVGALKPSPASFLEMAQRLGCSPGEVLYVGNSRRYDVEGAKRAGMKSALVTGLVSKPPPEGTDADFTFRDYRKLRSFVLN
jgi:putative hydrolase of the HAD superfamily